MPGRMHHDNHWPHEGGWWLVPVLMYLFVLFALLGAMLVWF